MLVFLDTEFTDFVEPQVLSIGAVTHDGREHYVELDMSTEVGQARLQAASDFVRHGGVLDLFGLVPGASATYAAMARRTADWLLRVAAESGGRVEVAFDYTTDYELVEYAIRDCGLWDRVGQVITPVDIGALTGTFDGESAAEDCYRLMHKRGLARHHALADAMALRAAYVAAAQGAAVQRSSAQAGG